MEEQCVQCKEVAMTGTALSTLYGSFTCCCASVPTVMKQSTNNNNSAPAQSSGVIRGQCIAVGLTEVSVCSDTGAHAQSSTVLLLRDKEDAETQAGTK